MSFFEEVEKIHHQISLPCAILIAIKGRVERIGNKFANRIGSAFPNGDQSVLIFGPGGTGKTTCMNKIYNGLKLQNNASFIESGGMATSIGLLELFQENANCMAFIDEMDWDNKDHLQLFKQVSNGKIYRQKSGGDSSFNFNGMIVAATNSITIPRGSKSEHLMATLDRFIVVRAEKASLDYNEILDNIITGVKQEEDSVDWNLIADRINSDWDSELTEGESSLIKRAWLEKQKECLDSTQENIRSMHRVKDCLLFVKRVSQSENVFNDDNLVKIFLKLVKDIVIVNKGNIAWMDFSERQIFTTVNTSIIPLSPKDILDICEERGIPINRRTLQRKLLKMVDQGFLFKYSHGKYWNKSDFNDEDSNCLIKM